MNFFWGSNNPTQRHSSSMQFSQVLSAYSSILMSRHDIDKGNKIILPASVLGKLSYGQNFGQVMIFCLKNIRSGKQTFAGVLEFVADQGTCTLPKMVFQNLELDEGEQIFVTLNKQIPKGRLIKIQPHETKFINLPDPRSVLEIELRNYTVLTQGDTISIKFLNQEFHVNILDVKPKNDFNCVCLIDADIEVDFAQPLDYIETPVKDQKMEIENQKMEQKGGAFDGKATRIDGKQITVHQQQQMKQNEQEEFNPRKHRLVRGLRGKQNYDFIGKGFNLK